jgi:DNA-binding CsgD family transcriptional regulator
MSADDDARSLPKSMRHKQVLDVAEKNPGASVEELASMVPSATAELVEHVLEEYGDPATTTESEEEPASTEENTADSDESSDQTAATANDTVGAESSEERASEDSEYPEPEALSEKQREVLAVIAAHPEATQREIGKQLGVSGSTVSNRVNSIEEFEWSDRASFVDAVYSESPSPETTADGGVTDETASSETVNSATPDTTVDIETELTRLEERIADLEATLTDETSETAAFSDPELVHKVVHACMESDSISEAEELRILQSLLE